MWTGSSSASTHLDSIVYGAIENITRLGGKTVARKPQRNRAFSAVLDRVPEKRWKFGNGKCLDGARKARVGWLGMLDC